MMLFSSVKRRAIVSAKVRPGVPEDCTSQTLAVFSLIVSQLGADTAPQMFS